MYLSLLLFSILLLKLFYFTICLFEVFKPMYEREKASSCKIFTNSILLFIFMYGIIIGFLIVKLVIVGIL
jgi:hypothetical protein